MLPFDPLTVSILPSKHFRNLKMRMWDWDLHDVRDALGESYKVVRVNRTKFEVWTHKGGSRKLILAYFPEENTVLIITGTESARKP